MHSEDYIDQSEKELWRAVLRTCIHDALGIYADNGNLGGYDRTALQRDAIWYLTNEGEDFRVLCELAGYNPDYVRERVLKKLNA